MYRSLAVSAILFLAVPVAAQELFDLPQTLQRMKTESHLFKPAATVKQGKPALVALLDYFFPETAERGAEARTEQAIRDLVAKLGSEKPEDRRAAEAELKAHGRPHRALIEMLAKQGDADVRLRLLTVLRSWEVQPPDFPPQYVAPLRVYFTAIKDPELLKLMAHRAIAVIRDSGANPRERADVLRELLRGVACAGDDQLGLLFKPLLKHKDPEVPKLILKAIGAHGQGNTYFPQLIVDALQSDRKEVLAAAIRSGPNCWDEKKSAAVKAGYRRVFTLGDEQLKFDVSFNLMHDFGDTEAYNHLLTQVDHKDPERARRAIYWVGDSCNYSRRVTDALLNRLTPLLKSESVEIRRAATLALGNYRDSKVIPWLIPMLADPESIIAEEATASLRGREDDKALREHLTEAAKKHESPTVRTRAAALLEGLDKKK